MYILVETALFWSDILLLMSRRGIGDCCSAKFTFTRQADLKSLRPLAPDEVDHPLVEELPLRPPHAPLGGDDAVLALLEERPREHGGAPVELGQREGLPDHRERVEHHARLPPDEDAEDVAVPRAKALEALAEVAHVEEEGAAEDGQAYGACKIVMCG